MTFLDTRQAQRLAQLKQCDWVTGGGFKASRIVSAIAASGSAAVEVTHKEAVRRVRNWQGVGSAPGIVAAGQAQITYYVASWAGLEFVSKMVARSRTQGAHAHVLCI
jgi:hypothetical protein